MGKTFDIAVAGGGPAGAATALCLSRRGWSVALCELTVFNQDRMGETLPPEINPVFEQIGLREAFLSQRPLESPGIMSVWGSSIPQVSDFTSNPFGCGWHVERTRFDQMLCREAVKAGTNLMLNQRAPWLRNATGWQAGELRAKFLVDATGRNGLRLPDFAERQREDMLLAVVFRVFYGQESLKDLRTCIEATPSGWWYSTLLPDCTGIAMFFTGSEIYRTGDLSIGMQLRAAPLTKRRLEGGLIGKARVVAVPCDSRKKIFGADWAAVGDSASSYDPLSGRGIFKALRQGRAAAQAIDAQLRGSHAALDRYASLVRRDFDQYSTQRAEYYSLEQRWADSPFWQARSRRRSRLEFVDQCADI